MDGHDSDVDSHPELVVDSDEEDESSSTVSWRGPQQAPPESAAPATATASPARSDRPLSQLQEDTKQEDKLSPQGWLEACKSSLGNVDETLCRLP